VGNTVALNGAGTAQCTTSSLSTGSHSIVASYSGDPANAASVSTALTQDISPPAGSSNVALWNLGSNTPAVSGTTSSGGIERGRREGHLGDQPRG